MGSRGSKAVANPIDVAIRKDQAKSLRVVRILLLGCGETGKSTFLKQVKILNNIALLPSFQNSTMETHLKTSIVYAARLLIQNFPKDFRFEGTFKQACEFISATEDVTENHETWVKHFEVFSSHKITRETYSKKIDLKIPIPIDLDYFFQRAPVMFAKSYELDQNDIVHGRSVTTGVHEFEFTPPDSKLTLHFIDVGGQASERRKWINQFDNVNAVLFFSALDSYCLAALPPHSSRLDEELLVWSSLQTQMPPNIFFIFLQNKADIFEKLIKTHPLNKYFPDISKSEGSDFDKSLQYLRAKFSAKYNRQGNLCFHVTNSVDRNVVEKIWDQIRNLIISKVFDRAGFAPI